MRFIDRVGIELEGGWRKVFKYNRLKHDGSVFPDGMIDDGPVEPHWGEIASPPLPTPVLVEEWLKVYYPDFSDESCGLHVHVSFLKTIYYERLARRAFYDYWLNGILDWGRKRGIKDSEFWSRIQGFNRFCQKEFRASEQVKLTDKGDGRRTHLNYCYKLHKTIECRAFPLFDNPEDAISAIFTHLKLINSYLKRQPTTDAHRLILKALE